MKGMTISRKLLLIFLVNIVVIGNINISLLGAHILSRECPNTETVIQRIIEMARRVFGCSVVYIEE